MFNIYVFKSIDLKRFRKIISTIVSFMRDRFSPLTHILSLSLRTNTTHVRTTFAIPF